MPWLRMAATAGSNGDSFGVAPWHTADLRSCLPTHGCWRWCSYPESTDTALAPRCSGTTEAFVLSTANRCVPWPCPDRSEGCKPPHRYCSQGVSRADSKRSHCQAFTDLLAARSMPVSIYRIALDNMKSESCPRCGDERDPNPQPRGRRLVHRRRSLEAEGGAFLTRGSGAGPIPGGGASAQPSGPRPAAL